MKKIGKKRLNIIIKRHELWLASEGKEGKQANLAGTDLSDADLKATDLRKAILAGACLKEADLYDADLSYADLSNADLSYAVLRCTKLENANTVGAIGLK